MKKLGLCLLALLMLGLSGCQKKEVIKEPELKEEKQAEDTAYTNQYGSIDTIVGNELTVKLAKNPFEENVVENDKGSDGEIVAATLTSAVASSGEEGESGAKERIELEYTDENLDLIIPAGVKIMNSAGKELTVKDLAKGDIVQVVQDTQGNIVNITKYE